MKASGPKHERETIITFNEEDDTCNVWTASDVTYRRLIKRLGMDHLMGDYERCASFTFPLKWLTLPRKRTPKKATPAQMAHLAKIHR